MNDRLVTLFGGGGFIGRYAAQALLAAGARVRIAQRDPRQAWFVKPLGGLGQTQFVAADITRPESVARAVAGSDAVVNLVGSFAAMQRIQAEGAGIVARAAAEAGAGALVHISAIGADAHAESVYGRTKGAGEAAVRAAFPAATILRPSIVFGREDNFVNRFAGLIRMLPVVPVIGGATKLQPVFVGDVGHAIAAAIADPARHAGATCELGGPEVLTMRALNERIAGWIGKRGHFIDLPDPLSALLARSTGWLPGAPITHDQWLMLQHDNVAAAAMPGLAALGIEPTPIGAVAPGWLVQYRRHGRFGGVKTA